MKATAISIYPDNKVPIVEMGTLEGDFNLLNQMLIIYCTSLERQKRSYIFRVNHDTIAYRYSLTKTEFEQAKKYLPDFK